MSKNFLIFDTDGGVDDAQALLMLIAHGRTPDVITTVFGNVALDTATDNILATLATVGANVPMHKGADRPLNQPIIDAKYIHGDDGLGGAPRPKVIQKPASSDAVDLLRKLFREAGGRGQRLDIMMIGPLTNLALALRTEPNIISGIGRLTIMGATLFGRGNTTPAAEFNIYADPEAASIVFAADIDIVVVPWEPCITHAMTGAQVDAVFAEIKDGPTKAFNQALARHLRNGVIGYGGGDMLRLVDPLASAVVVEPGIIRKTVSASIGVSLAPGIARGMTVVDPSGRLGTRKHTLIEEVDADRLAELYAISAAYTG